MHYIYPIKEHYIVIEKYFTMRHIVIQKDFILTIFVVAFDFIITSKIAVNKINFIRAFA